MREILFHYDIVCPWAFLAARQLADLERRTGVTVRWRPVLLGGLFRHHGVPDSPMSTWSAQRADWGRIDLLRTADLAGVEVRFPPTHPRRTVDAMRLCLLAPDEIRPELSFALWEAYWQHGRDVADPAVLAEIATRFGLDPGAIPSMKQPLIDVTEEAARAGAFGVPTYRYGERLYWGGDRVPLIEHDLGFAVRRPGDGDPAPATGRVIRFFHDFSSPFSYLASARIERVARRWGATVDWRPILLGALFRDIGTPDVPLLAMHDARRRWFAQDMGWWADFWGVPFRFATTFPLRTVTPLRVAVQDPATTPAIYRAAWVDQVDIGDEAALATVLRDAGFDADRLLAGAQDPGVKATLRENTDHARAIGTPGVPTFQLDDGPFFWGQDRLWQLERALSGWEAAS